MDDGLAKRGLRHHFVHRYVTNCQNKRYTNPLKSRMFVNRAFNCTTRIVWIEDNQKSAERVVFCKLVIDSINKLKIIYAMIIYCCIIYVFCKCLYWHVCCCV